MIISIVVVALIGFLIASYTYYLEQKIKAVPSYKPMCDISDSISCTKPMKSKYASLFYFSNALVAMAFYIVMMALATLNASGTLMVLSVCACLVSCAFAYILYFKIKTLCVLCTSLYCINFILLYLSLNAAI